MSAHGFVETGFEEVLAEFSRNFEERGDVGAAFAAYLDDRTVVDLWGGLADRDERTEWQEGTLQVVFSGTKGLVAVCLLVLIEGGRLRLDDPVSAYWPEFGAAGKEDTLVAHVVSHQAGLPGIREPVGFDDVLDGTRMAELLARQRPFWPPGSRPCYHPFTFGWLCGELVRRIDGRSVGTFFADEVAGPLELDIWIGLPPDQEQRVSSLCRSDGPPAPAPICDPSIAHAIDHNPPLLVGKPHIWNTRKFHAAEIPGAGAIGTARSLSRLYACLARGGELDGVRLLRPETIDLGRRCLSRGRDACFDWPFAFGVGFALQNESRELGPPPEAFGHGGAGGSIHGAWPEERVGFSYCMNEMREDLGRSDPLLAALHRAVRRAGKVS